MQRALKEKLWAYIVRNHPDLMFRLQENDNITRYLEEKVAAVTPVADQLRSEGRPEEMIEQWCVDVLTEDLKPSRYQYLRSVLKEEFPQEYGRLKEKGTLTGELIRLIDACKLLFDEFDFNVENEGNRQLRHAVIGQLRNQLI